MIGRRFRVLPEARAVPRPGESMRRLTLTERLLLVALLPALALLARQAFGPAEPPVWLLFEAAVSILTPVLAVLLGLAITTAIRRATQAVNGLAGSGARDAAQAHDAAHARAEEVRLSAAVSALIAASRKRHEA